MAQSRPSGGDHRTVGAAPSSPRESPAPAPTPTEIYHGHYVSLLRLATMLVGHRETAEDVVQDVFTTLHHRRSRFTGWDGDRMLRYTRTAIINRSRSALRHRVVVSRHSPEPPGDAVSAEAHAVAGADAADVREALKTLPRRQREVVLLRYLVGLPVAETARVLRIGDSAVTSSTARALARLKDALGAHWGEEGS